MNRIKVKFDKELKMISVYNNGKGIPIEIHKISNVYVPEMLFGQLMTSSNYNSRKKFRGIGAKITNLFSTQFTVETTDTTQKKRYIQTFRNNMTQTGNPEITDYNNKEEYTKVSFIPDLERFGMTELTDDAIALQFRSWRSSDKLPRHSHRDTSGPPGASPAHVPDSLSIHSL